jgi:hypothetical protein
LISQRTWADARNAGIDLKQKTVLSSKITNVYTLFATLADMSGWSKWHGTFLLLINENNIYRA